jgi:lipoprotein-anchoring transpeptidase ErfK/SrfK
MEESMFNYKLFFSIAVFGGLSCAIAITGLLPRSIEANEIKKELTAPKNTKQVGGDQSLENSLPSQDQVSVSSLVKLQILLDRAGFSSGEIDGSARSNVRKAISAFQDAHGLSRAGRSDDATLEALASAELTEPLVSYTISDQDAAGPFTETIPNDLMEQSKLPGLGYTSILEGLGEKFHSKPSLLQKLNPSAQFQAGDTILVPNVFNLPDDAQTQNHAAPKSGKESLRIKGGYTIVVTERTSDVVLKDPNGEILFHAPATVGSEHDRLPIGGWKVTTIHRNPVFSYNPDLFWDANATHSKAKIAAGPNNPVGLVWIGLNAPNYGLHGTPEPGKIGHSESHGCIRMTNWDALRLASLIKVGTDVIFQ